MSAAKVRVLIVEDSPVVREMLVYVLGNDPGIEIAGTAEDGEAAIEAVQRTRPDVVTMDYHLPKMNGMIATRKIMESCPVPIVMVSGSTARDEALEAFHVLEAGALAVVEKPPGIGHPGHHAAVKDLVQTVKLMAEVKVVKRWPRREAAVPAAVRPAPAGRPSARDEVRLVAIGASTGGPIVLKTILSGLPKDFAVPVLIVQHIAAGFTEGLVGWLAQSTGFAVRVATDREHPLPGHAYVAPDSVHMSLAHDGRISLNDGAPENGHRPSVSKLFRSVAATLDRKAIGVLLTGMGKDGAAELKAMKDRGAVTLAQDRASSTVYGMPGEAAALDAATHMLDPREIATTLAGLVAAGTKGRNGR